MWKQSQRAEHGPVSEIVSVEQDCVETGIYATLLKYFEFDERNVSVRYLLRLEGYSLVRHFLGDKEYQSLRAWW